MAKTGSTIATTYYVGSHFEKETVGSTTTYRHNIMLHGKSVATVLRPSSGGQTTQYPLRDHANSVVVVTDDSSSVIQRFSYDSFGKRRNTNWTADTADIQFSTSHITERGYTGHEHMDNTRLINMNGRVQDPIIGRMVSADPSVPNPLNGQSYNRYSYAINNPLSRIDPTGFTDCRYWFNGCPGPSEDDHDSHDDDGGGDDGFFRDENSFCANPYIICVDLLDDYDLNDRTADELDRQELADDCSAGVPVSGCGEPDPLTAVQAISEGVAIEGIGAEVAGDIYKEKVAPLPSTPSPEGTAARSQIKKEVRKITPPVTRSVIEHVRPDAGAQPRTGGTPNRASEAANKMARRLGVVGKLGAGAAVATGGYRIATAENKVRESVKVGGEAVGGGIGWWGGAAGGAALFGPPRAIAGALIFGIGGAWVGGEIAEEAYDTATEQED